MYLSMLKLKQRFEMEMKVGSGSVVIPEDWMADLTPGDVNLFLRM